jgi:hypothetical protein
MGEMIKMKNSEPLGEVSVRGIVMELCSVTRRRPI